MANKENVKMKVPSVLAFEKKLVLSDGYLYGTNWEERQSKAVPLNLVEKTIRGTISNRQSKATVNDPMKLNKNIQVANIQTVDACALPMDCNTLKLVYTMKVLSGIESPCVCNEPEFAASYLSVAKNYIEKTGFHELATRYATNIVNARSLWRNRLGAEKIEVCVSEVVNQEEHILGTFNSYDYSVRNFDKTDGLSALANAIADALCGNRASLFLRIEIFALLGEGQEVYPSEEFVFTKNKGDKSKLLYQVDGIAAIHSQKLGNAIRTIDTWYPDFATENVGPIAIETFGTVTNLGRGFRHPKDKVDFYTLFDRYAQGEPLDTIEKEHYVMAVLVRGGVFGESSKEPKEG